MLHMHLFQSSRAHSFSLGNLNEASNSDSTSDVEQDRDTMSGGMNSFHWQSGRDNSNELSYSSDSNHLRPMFPRTRLVSFATNARSSSPAPWRPSDETLLTGLVNVDSFHEEPARPRVRILSNERYGQLNLEPPQTQWNIIPIPRIEDDSRLTRDEQKKALKKLKKEVYNPVPKSITRRISLYYRDKNTNTVNAKLKESEEEDGKRCAICLDDFEPKQEVMVTPCNHMFHEDCIVPWVKSNGQCPVCRFGLCEQMGQTQRPLPLSLNNNNNSNNFANVRANDHLSTGELLSIIRAMEEAFLLHNLAP